MFSGGLSVFLTVLATVNCQGSTGPVGSIIVHELSQCNPVVDEVSLTMELITYDDESKGVNMVASVPYDLREGEIELVLVADKWENNQWQKEAFMHTGNYFEFLNQYIPKIWDNVRDKAEPKIENNNMIPAGEYKVMNYTEMSKNVELPQIIYGRFKAYFYISKDDKNINCVMAEGESLPPETM